MEKLKSYIKKNIKKPLFRLCYELFALKKLDNLKFMNYGLVLDEKLELKKEDEKERLQLQLYYYLTKSVHLENKTILEIGCGRGGGSNFIAEYKNPKKIVGIDITKGNIKICNNYFSKPNLSYLQGDAENLTFPESSFDVVLNVESSHCYPNMDKFLNGVHKVLKNDGHFVFCDVRTPQEFKDLETLFTTCNFTIHYQENITKQILNSLQKDNERKLKLIKENYPYFQQFVLNFAFIEGSENYINLSTGVTQYKMYILQKHH